MAAADALSKALGEFSRFQQGSSEWQNAHLSVPHLPLKNTFCARSYFSMRASSRSTPDQAQAGKLFAEPWCDTLSPWRHNSRDMVTQNFEQCQPRLSLPGSHAGKMQLCIPQPSFCDDDEMNMINRI